MSEIFNQHDLTVGECARFRVGFLDLLVIRDGHGWTLSWQYAPSTAAPRMSADRPATIERLGVDAEQRSFAFGQSQGPLELVPMLSDRPIIVRPLHDVTVGPKALVKLYVTTALWIGVRVGGDAQTLAELPSVWPKQTWFGPNTLEGERCYAGRQPLCHHATGCASTPHRVITPLVLHNRSVLPLPIARLRLPVPRLPLHLAQGGGYWTSRVSVTRRDSSDDVEVEVLPSAPEEAGMATLVAPARNSDASNVVSRALGSVFNHSLIP